MPSPYADLPLLKSQLSISDSQRDTLLNAALNAASRSVDDFCGRRFYLDATTSQRVYNPTHRLAGFNAVTYAAQSLFIPSGAGLGTQFIVDDIGDTAGLVVEYGSNSAGWTALTPDDYLPENAVARGEPITGLVCDTGFPMMGTTRLRVTAKWGWPAVPDQVVEATLILAARLFRRKDSPEGVIGTAEWGTVRLSRTDPDVAALLSRFVILGFA